MPVLARLVTDVCSPFPFRVEGDTPDEIHTALAELLAKEIQSVQGYVRTWRSAATMHVSAPGTVPEETAAHVAKDVFAWPSVDEAPTPERADGRFVKAFPLVFPMGVADLYQPRLRSDFQVVDAVQHLFRYVTGHVLRVNDGHRVTWALFNTGLREISHQKGGLVYKNAHATALTKAELRTL